MHISGTIYWETGSLTSLILLSIKHTLFISLKDIFCILYFLFPFIQKNNSANY